MQLSYKEMLFIARPAPPSTLDDAHCTIDPTQNPCRIDKARLDVSSEFATALQRNHRVHGASPPKPPLALSIALRVLYPQITLIYMAEVSNYGSWQNPSKRRQKRQGKTAL